MWNIQWQEKKKWPLYTGDRLCRFIHFLNDRKQTYAKTLYSNSNNCHYLLLVFLICQYFIPRLSSGMTQLWWRPSIQDHVDKTRLILMLFLLGLSWQCLMCQVNKLLSVEKFEDTNWIIRPEQDSNPRSTTFVVITQTIIPRMRLTIGGSRITNCKMWNESEDTKTW
jgi:hypothetical protein